VCRVFVPLFFGSLVHLLMPIIILTVKVTVTGIVKFKLLAIV